MAIVCIGDSLTFGNVGYSYIHFLKTRERIINRGINGDTTRCAYKRLKKIIMSPRYEPADTYIISIGTNDVLLPYLKTVSALWKRQMEPRCRIKKCITEDERFAAEYEKYLKLLSEHGKKVIVVGLPCIQLEHYPQRTLIRRNRMIAMLAEKYGVPFIDIYAMQRSISANPRAFSWKHRNVLRLTDSAIMTAFPFTKDWFGKFRRLELTIDGVHFNSTSAKALASRIDHLLESDFMI